MGIQALSHTTCELFGLDEWAIFFGRERMVDDVIDRMGGSQFVVVHGASGSGKSSLVRAGVIAQLQREHANRGLDWRPAAMMPGSSPMWHFAVALVRALTHQDVPDHSETAKARLRLNRGADGVAEVLSELNFNDDQRLFLLVDQFEEIFRFADEGGMREATDFIRLLVDLQHRCLPHVYVVLTMRSDHLGDCSRFAGLAEIVNTTQYLVPSMDDSELEDAICRPARLYQGTVDPALARQLIRDTDHSADQLPLIQHALAYMWDLEAKRMPAQAVSLNLDSYRDKAVGSAPMALSNHANVALNELTDQNSHACATVEKVFRALTKIDDSGRAIRRRLSLTELLAEVGGSQESLDPVIKAFTRKDRSFLVVEADDPQRDPKIDISHEALIRHWTELNNEKLDANGQPIGWLSREASDGRIWQSLVAFVDSAGDSDNVYLPPAVYERRQAWWASCNPTPAWSQKHGSQFEKIEALLERSHKHIEEEQEREREAQQREREALQARERVRKLTLWIAWIAGIATVVLGILTWYTMAAQVRADLATERAVEVLQAQWRVTVDAAKANSGEQSSDLWTDLLITLEFLPDQDSENAKQRDQYLISNVESILRNVLDQYDRTTFVLIQHQGEVDGVAYSPDGRWIATGADDHTIRLWEATTGALHLKLVGHSEDISRLAFSPDSTRMVSGSIDQTARIWEVETGRELHQLTGHTALIWGVAWSPKNNPYIATGSWDHTIRIWNADTGDMVRVLEGHTGYVRDVTFSPDGSRLLSTSEDGTALIWDMKPGSQPSPFANHTDKIYTAAWSSDGKLIATGGKDKIVRIWEADSARLRYELSHGEPVWSIAFSPDSNWLATGSDDDLTRIWNIETGALKRMFNRHTSDVDAVAWSPDSKRIVTGSDDATARIMVAIDDDEGQQTDTADTQELVDRAKQIVPRCLGEEERERLRLAKEIPTWCRDMRKPPFDARGRFQRALALLNQAPPDDDEAARLFEEAKRLDPSLSSEIEAQNQETLRKRIRPLLAKGEALLTQDKPDDDAAAKLYEIAENRAPSLADEIEAHKRHALQIRGRHLIEQGVARLIQEVPDEHEAQQRFEEAIALAPSLAADIEKQKIEALKQRGLELIAHGVNAFEKIAPTLAHSGRYAEPAIALAPSLTAVFKRARLRFIIDSGQRMLVENREQEAQQAFDQALALVPEAEPEVIVARVRAALELGQPEVALLLALELDPERYDSEPLLSEIVRDDPHGVFRGHQSEVDSIAYSPDGKWIASGSDDNTVRLWEAATGNLHLTLIGHSEDISRLAFSPDSARIVSGSIDRTAYIWEVETGERLHRLTGHNGFIWGVAWSPTGLHVATGSWDRSIRIWNAETGHLERELIGHKSRVRDVAFSPDGSRLLSTSEDGTARIWDVKTGTEHIRFKGHQGKRGKGKVYAAAWSPDARLIATGGSDKTIRIWEADNGGQRFELKHEQSAWSVAFSPDGKWLVTGSKDDLARIWDVETGALKRTLRGDGKDVDAVAWSPDNAQVVTGSDDAVVRIYQVSSLTHARQSLFRHALGRVSRCLTEEERRAFALPPKVSKWCAPHQVKAD